MRGIASSSPVFEEAQHLADEDTLFVLPPEQIEKVRLGLAQIERGEVSTLAEVRERLQKKHDASVRANRP